MGVVGKRSYVQSTPYSRQTRFKASTSGPLSFSYGNFGVSTPSVSASYESSTNTSSLATSLTGGASGKISGFVATSLKKNGGTNIYNTNGVVRTCESGGIVDAGASTQNLGNTVAVGHNNVPQSLMMLCIWESLIKKLFLRFGYGEVSAIDSATDGFNAGDEVILTYRVNADSNLITRTFTFTGIESISVIGASFWNYFQSSIGTDSTLQFYSLRFKPNSLSTIWPAVTFSLVGSKAHFFGKSSLKMQNRSSNGTNDEEALDNNPLQGKAYFGIGSGAIAYTKDTKPTTASVGFVGNDKVGAIAKVPAERWYQEPVPANHFSNVKQHGKVLLEAGHIKTSVLYSEHKVPLDALYRMFNSDRDTGGSAWLTTHTNHKMGFFRFVLLEKMINAVPGTASNAIKVAYEVNFRCGAYVTLKRDTTSTDLLDLGAYSNEA